MFGWHLCQYMYRNTHVWFKNDLAIDLSKTLRYKYVCIGWAGAVSLQWLLKCWSTFSFVSTCCAWQNRVRASFKEPEDRETAQHAKPDTGKFTLSTMARFSNLFVCDYQWCPQQQGFSVECKFRKSPYRAHCTQDYALRFPCVGLFFDSVKNAHPPLTQEGQSPVFFCIKKTFQRPVLALLLEAGADHLSVLTMKVCVQGSQMFHKLETFGSSSKLCLHNAVRNEERIEKKREGHNG